jgi:hypothetical protein
MNLFFTYYYFQKKTDVNYFHVSPALKRKAKKYLSFWSETSHFGQHRTQKCCKNKINLYR